jgi:glycosyltransferase involved in cell wall biosynthesis
VFAGRHIREKRVPLVIEAIKLAKREIPELRGMVFGRGPEFNKAFEMIRDVDYIALPGFVHRSVLLEAMSRALCLLHPTEREGYGMVVVEAAAYGTPSILVAGLDNAAAELVDEGVNGYVVDEPSAEQLAKVILAAHRAGEPLRASTAAWYSRNAERLSMGGSLDQVVSGYGPPPRRPPSKSRQCAPTFTEPATDTRARPATVREPAG